jgi:hypothetical protein
MARGRPHRRRCAHNALRYKRRQQKFRGDNEEISSTLEFTYFPYHASRLLWHPYRLPNVQFNPMLVP